MFVDNRMDLLFFCCFVSILSKSFFRNYPSRNIYKRDALIPAENANGMNVGRIATTV